MGRGMVAASCVILIDLVTQIVSWFPRPVPVPGSGLVWVSRLAQRLTNGEFRLLWVVGWARYACTYAQRQTSRFPPSRWYKTLL